MEALQELLPWVSHSRWLPQSWVTTTHQNLADRIFMSCVYLRTAAYCACAERTWLLRDRFIDMQCTLSESTTSCWHVRAPIVITVLRSRTAWQREVISLRSAAQCQLIETFMNSMVPCLHGEVDPKSEHDANSLEPMLIKGHTVLRRYRSLVQLGNKSQPCVSILQTCINSEYPTIEPATVSSLSLDSCRVRCTQVISQSWPSVAQGHHHG